MDNKNNVNDFLEEGKEKINELLGSAEKLADTASKMAAEKATELGTKAEELTADMQTQANVLIDQAKLKVAELTPEAEARLKELEEKANTLEKELTQTIAGYADALRQVKWQEVQATLPKSAMALEFVHFNVDFPKKTDSVQYAVLLLRQGAAQPEFIPLFEQKELNHIASEFKGRSESLGELYVSQRGLVPTTKKKELAGTSSQLYNLIWKKIEDTGLEGITTIYYSSSGVLHRLNLYAIHIDKATTLSN